MVAISSGNLGNSTKPLLVYFIEDDEDLREEYVDSLIELGFKAEGFPSGAPFYRAQLLDPCDIAVIDVGLPGEDGFSIAAHVRASGRTGVIMLTARGALADRLHGLRQGADAYMVKPANMLELAATIEAIARRIYEPPGSAHDVVSQPIGNIRLSTGGWNVEDTFGRSMPLTASERAFMQVLVSQMGKPVSRDDLIKAMGGDVFDFDPHRIDALVSRIRKKARDSGITLNLRPVRGVGYLLSA